MKRERRNRFTEITNKCYLHTCCIIIANFSFTNDVLDKSMAHCNQNELLESLAHSVVHEGLWKERD